MICQKRFGLFLAAFLFCFIGQTISQTAPSSPARTPTTRPIQDAAVPVIKSQSWLRRHQQFVDRAKEGDVDIVFIGDSITALWTRPTGGGDLWNARYAPRKAVDFGISGDRTQHVLWRIQNGEFDNIAPKAIVLLIGTNNTTDNTPANVADAITACVNALKQKCPTAKIVLMAIFPRGDTPTHILRTRVNAINAQIKSLADGDTVQWLDLTDQLTLSDGTVSKEILFDNVHPTTKGFQIWADALDPVLNKIVH